MQCTYVNTVMIKYADFSCVYNFCSTNCTNCTVFGSTLSVLICVAVIDTTGIQNLYILKSQFRYIINAIIQHCNDFSPEGSKKKNRFYIISNSNKSDTSSNISCVYLHRFPFSCHCHKTLILLIILQEQQVSGVFSQEKRI